MTKNLDITIEPPEFLGEPVQCRLGQSAAYNVNPKGEKELYFAANGKPAVFYVLDLLHGHVKFSFDIPGSDTVWAMAVGSDGNVYFSCTTDGILYCYSTEDQQVNKVAVSSDDRFVWDIQAAGDGTIVTATYPRSKIFAYNTHTSEFSDLGRMSNEEHYARGAAVSNDAVYTGIGSTMHLIRYDRQTGEKEELHVEGYSGKKGFIDRVSVISGLLFLSINGSELVIYDEKTRSVVDQFESMGNAASVDEENKVYFIAKSQLHSYHLEKKQKEKIADLPYFFRTTKIKLMQQVTLTEEEWTAIQRNVSGKPEQSQHSFNRQHVDAAGKSVLIIVSCYADVWYCDLQTGEIIHQTLDVPAKPILIQTLETDDNGILYIGGYHRGLCIYDPAQKHDAVQLPAFPQIEGIGFLNQNVYFGTYTKANIYVYDRTKPLQIADERANDANPRHEFQIQHGQDRPFTFTAGDSYLFAGTTPDYGLNTGALTIYNETEDEWTVYPDVAPNLSITGLAYHHGLLYGGTSIWGGLGKEPVESEAYLFMFDVAKKEVIKRFTPEIPQLDLPPKMIGELSVGPDGNIWGAVDGTLFVMEPVTGNVLRSLRVSESKYHGKFRPYYLRWGEDGLLYTALGRKLVVIHPETFDYDIVDEGPLSLMTLGKDGHIYYGIGSRLYRRKVSP